MSSISFLNAKAQDKCKYQRFDELAPGKYLVQEFYIKEEKYGNRLCMKIDGGQRYLILPKRFTDQSSGAVNVENLNLEPVYFVFEGKQGDFELNFHFQPATSEPPTLKPPSDEHEE